MAIRGFSFNISDKRRGKQATAFAQWIGAFNVMRNQKRAEYVALLADGKGDQINQTLRLVEKVVVSFPRPRAVTRSVAS